MSEVTEIYAHLAARDPDINKSNAGPITGDHLKGGKCTVGRPRAFPGSAFFHYLEHLDVRLS
jgi:hypothetical protein